MSKFTDEEDALNAKRCPECEGSGCTSPYHGICHSCSGNGLKVDPFERFEATEINEFKYISSLGNELRITVDVLRILEFIETTFNAGRDSK